MIAELYAECQKTLRTLKAECQHNCKDWIIASNPYSAENNNSWINS